MYQVTKKENPFDLSFVLTQFNRTSLPEHLQDKQHEEDV